MITLTANGPAERRDVLEEFGSDYEPSGLTTVEQPCRIRITRRWEAPNPHLDHFVDRHPFEVADDVCYELDEYVLCGADRWTVNIEATTDDILESAEAAAGRERAVSDVLKVWNDREIFPDKETEDALDRQVDLEATPDASPDAHPWDPYR